MLLDMRDDHLKIVQGILKKYVPAREVWAFGSRAKWLAKEYSDLDLCILGEAPLSFKTLGLMEEAFDESDLPYKVDVVDWATTSELFRRIIEKDKVVVQSPEKGARGNWGTEWSLVPIGEVAQLFDGPHATPKKTLEGPVFLGISSLKRGQLDLSSTEHLSDEDYAKWTRRVVPSSDDVVFSYETRIGDVAIIPEGLKCCLGRRMALLRPDQTRLLPKYLLYYFLSDEFQDFLRTRTIHGSTVERLPLTDFPSYPVRIPPIQVQRSISETLQSLDDRITLLRETNTTLEAIAQALFKSWFVDFDPVRAKMEGRAPEGMDEATAALFPDSFEETELGVVPRGWRALPLAEAMEINPTRKLKKGELAPYLDMASVGTQGHVADATVPREMGSGSKFVNGDTLLARITPCLENGKTAFVDFLPERKTGWGSTEFVVLRPRTPLPDYFAYLLCRHGAFREFAIQSMSGTSGRQRIQNDVLGRYPVAVPTIEIAEIFGETVSALQQRIAANHASSQTLASLRDTLLPRLISGQIRLPETQSTLKGTAT